MTRQAFLDELKRLTGAMSEPERARLMEYYSEMIDDRMEEGIAEEEAVAALGDPARIASQFADAAPAEPAGGAETVDALENLRVRVGNADVKILREPLPGGAAAQLRFSDPTRFTWRAEGSELIVEERDPEGDRFSLRWLKKMILDSNLRLTVALSEGLAGSLDLSSGGGDLSVENLTLGGDAIVRTASGDIHLASVACGAAFRMENGRPQLINIRPAELRVHTSSGDIEAQDVRVSGDATLESASGDMELRGFDCATLTLKTASGDIEFDRGRSAGASVRAASGDVRMDEVECDPMLDIETASGDVELTCCIARQTRVRTASGDVELRLEPLPCGYDISTNTVSGDVCFNDGCTASSGDPQPEITVRTVSGDIEVRLAR